MWEKEKYILLENKVSHLCTSEMHDQFISNLTYTRKLKDFYSVSTPHPVLNWAKSEGKIFLAQLVKSEFNIHINLNNITSSISMMTGSDGIEVHNDDYNKNEVPVRGLIYINPEKMFGTKILDTDHEPGDPMPPYRELGGNPGDIFLFCPSATSWHTVGFENNTQPRFTVNVLFRY
jgi:hypothetical protein